MAATTSTYYNLIRLREMGPEAKDWATTDGNFQVISLIMKALEQHTHDGIAAMLGPASQPSLSESTTGGSLTPGVTVGVRLSYLNAAGLETEATQEEDITLGVGVQPPTSPTLVTIASATNALSGGIYTYVMTKSNGSGETLPSSALPVTVAYDKTYSVEIDWDDPISSMTDGTTQLEIYRSAGFGSSFQLVAEITDDAQTSYIDTNVSVDQTQQPPSSSTFDATKSLIIDFSNLVHPSDATTLNIYVTQQSGVFSTENLLAQIDLTQASPPTSYTYLGSETLNAGYPLESTQIPSSPSPISFQGLTEDLDFQRHQAVNFVTQNASTPPSSAINGEIYYDTSINNIRAYINGTWVNWGTTTGSTYTHPAEEVGGHLATNIRWVSGSSSPSVADLLSKFWDSTGYGKNAYTEQRFGFSVHNYTGSVLYTTNSTTPTPIPGLTAIVTTTINVQPIEITFSAEIQQTILAGGAVYIGIYDDTGLNYPNSTRGFFAQQSTVMTMTISTPSSPGTRTFYAYWWTDSASVTASFYSGSITAKVLL